MINEHELQLVNEMAISIYRRGYEDGVVETEKINDKAHDDGYNKGLYDAWECARKIVFTPSAGGLTAEEMCIIFNHDNVMRNYTASEAIAKIKEYEEKQKPKFAYCSLLDDECAYPYITCNKCEVHCSIERAKQKLKGDKE